MDPDTQTRMSAHLKEFIERIWKGGLRILLEGQRQDEPGQEPEPRFMQGTFGEIQVTVVFETDAYKIIIRQTMDGVLWQVVFRLPRVYRPHVSAQPIIMEPRVEGRLIRKMVQALIAAWPILPDMRQKAFTLNW